MTSLLDGMAYEQAFLLVALRKIVTGRGRCPVLVREIARLPDCDPQDLLRTYAILLSAIDNGCRRPLSINPVAATDATFDERRVMALLAAAQREEDAAVRAHLCWMVEEAHRMPVAIAARILGRLLTRAGITIPAAPTAAAVNAMPLAVVA